MKKIFFLCFIFLSCVLFGALFLFWDHISLEKLGLSDPWQRRYMNGNEIIYKLNNSYENCETIDQIIAETGTKKAFVSQEAITRLEYLDTLFRAHCIDISKTEVGEDQYKDTNTLNIRSQKIIQTAQDYGILRARTENSENEYFYPNKTITKIEALAFLLRLQNIELQEGSYIKNNFTDVNIGWQRDISDISKHLSLVYVSRSQNNFYPFEAMTEGRILRIFETAFRYYR